MRKIYKTAIILAKFLHIPSDKLLHFTCSAIITFICLLFTPKLIAGSIALGVGIGKEIYNCYKKNPTGWSWGDLLADGLGIIVILLVSLIC